MTNTNATTSPQQITRLLLAWADGDSDAAERLSNLVYEEVREIAAKQLRRFSYNPTLRPTELANDLFVRLLESHTAWRDRRHFYSAITIAMRRLLIDASRARRSDKRGSAYVHVTLSAAMDVPVESIEAESLERILEALRAIDPRKAEIIELNYLLGIKREEIAAALEISVPTVDRELRFARAWLKEQVDK